MDENDFTISYIIDNITNSPEGHQLLPNDNVCIIYNNGEDPIPAKGSLGKLQCYHTQCENSESKISLYRKKIYQFTNIEEPRSIFDQIRPVISNLEVSLLEKPKPPKKVGP